jgi:hypothetical protein
MILIPEQVFSSVNITDSKRMHKMTEAAVRDSAAVSVQLSFRFPTSLTFSFPADEADSLPDNGIPSCLLHCGKFTRLLLTPSPLRWVFISWPSH